MKKFFPKDKPEKGEVIVFKCKKSKLPEIGIFETFENGSIEEVYVPANDDVENISNIEWWFSIPN